MAKARKQVLTDKQRRSLADSILAHAYKCYRDTTGLRLYSTDESDIYWEFSENVMGLIAKAHGLKKPLRRRPE
jgi:hypothetical protein